MTDHSCDYCDKTGTCEYAWKETYCEKAIFDKVKNMEKIDLDSLRTYYEEVLEILRSNKLDEEDFYCMTKNAWENIQYYIK